MTALPTQHCDSSVTPYSLSHPHTPARSTNPSQNTSKAGSPSKRSPSDRLGPVGEERSSPLRNGPAGGVQSSKVISDDSIYVQRSLLHSVDELLQEGGPYRVHPTTNIINLDSPQRQSVINTSLPSLGGDSTTLDNSHSFDLDNERAGHILNDYQELAFSPLRMNQRVGKPQSSPGAKTFLGEPRSFFDDLTGPHIASLAPLESTPRKVPPLPGSVLHHNTLPRAQPQSRRPPPINEPSEDDSGSGDHNSASPHSDSPSANAQISEKMSSKHPDLHDRLSATQVNNAQLQEQCETMSHEIASLRDALQQMAIPQTHHYLHHHLAPGNETLSGPIWGQSSPALGGTRGLYPEYPSGAWSGRHSPSMPEMKSCEGSPSMNYIGLSLINSIQAQLQAGMDGQSPAPGTPAHRNRMTVPHLESSIPYPSATGTILSSPSQDIRFASPSLMPTHANGPMGSRSHRSPYGNTTSNSPGQNVTSAASLAAPPALPLPAFAASSHPPWLTQSGHPYGLGMPTVTRHIATAATDRADRSLPELSILQQQAHAQHQHYSQLSSSQSLPTLPVKPRHSAPGESPPYMSASPFGTMPGIASSGLMSPPVVSAAKVRPLDSLTPPDVLVARALSGRSQEASIILQQQLKSGSAERQTAIVRSITPHLLALSEDKHGNFLVQRAIGIKSSVAWQLKGSYARLALSQYGCHVVQRILDEDEPLKMAVVEELLSQNLLETLTSRNSVHVWAKALEIKWSSDEFRKNVFQVINSAMRGHWALTAMQETGSIVVQNLFESAQGDEKKDCIEEILERLPDCAANQWGVWVVQHIIEHGDDESREIAFNKLLSEAAMLSMSQFGQKAIMTALKSRDANFIAGYLGLLCDGVIASANGSANGGEGNTSNATSNAPTSGRRSMLVDIASTPQGLQIMTQLLTTISRDDRERIIKAVRKNSVFLKGTKTGLKVHQMCERARAFTGY